MTNNQHGQVPAIQRYKIGYHSDDAGPWVRYEDHAAVITALRTRQPAPATQKLKEQMCINDINQSAACAVGSVGTTSDAQTTHSTHDAPATPITVEQVEDAIGLQSSAWDTVGAEKIVEAVLRLANAAPATQQVGEVVAYLDIGAGGYLDLGSELSEDALQQLPKGRHALVIAGTYGIDGYVAAPQPVVREPLPKFTALRFRARRDKKAEVTLLFQGHETADAWVRGITKKGGSNAE